MERMSGTGMLQWKSPGEIRTGRDRLHAWLGRQLALHRQFPQRTGIPAHLRCRHLSQDARPRAGSTFPALPVPAPHPTPHPRLSRPHGDIADPSRCRPWHPLSEPPNQLRSPDQIRRAESKKRTTMAGRPREETAVLRARQSCPARAAGRGHPVRGVAWATHPTRASRASG
jgi:hypothetical protein